VNTLKSLLIILFFLFFYVKIFSQSINDTTLFNSFTQGYVDVPTRGGGNCASIALIKAAIGTYGLDHVFKYLVDSSKKIFAVVLNTWESIRINF
jgi:hypothetical protein